MTYKITYSNGDTINTKFNGSLEDVQDYYIGQWFNIGIVSDDMQICTKVELV